MTAEVTISRRDAEILIKADRSLAQHYEKSLRELEERLVEDGAMPEQIESELTHWRAEYARSRLKIFMETWRVMISWAHEGYPKQDRKQPTVMSTLQ